jgi:autoinducer 2-degrading protein
MVGDALRSLIVSLDVRPEKRDEFLQAIRTNAGASVRDEPGCIRFDVLELTESKNRFVLYEVYEDEEAIAMHRSSAHYTQWRAAASECLVPESFVVRDALLVHTVPGRTEAEEPKTDSADG